MNRVVHAENRLQVIVKLMLPFPDSIDQFQIRMAIDFVDLCIHLHLQRFFPFSLPVIYGDSQHNPECHKNQERILIHFHMILMQKNCPKQNCQIDDSDCRSQKIPFQECEVDPVKVTAQKNCQQNNDPIVQTQSYRIRRVCRNKQQEKRRQQLQNRDYANIQHVAC